MSDDTAFRTISFDNQAEIIAAIQSRESFEVGGCQGRMSDALLFLERTIGGEGMTSRTFTKGRTAALLPALALPGVAAVAAASIAAHNLATLNPDYEIMKRQIDGILRVTYVKGAPSTADKASSAFSAFGRGLSRAAEKATQAAKQVGTEVAAATGKAKNMASEAADSVAAAWEEHAPSKETVVGTAVLGGIAPFVLDKEQVAGVGAKVIGGVTNAAETAVSTVKNASPWAIVGGAIIGVGAVAAAPFTGGGSVAGAATLAASLAGAGATATTVGLAGAAAGAALSNASKAKSGEDAFRRGQEAGTAEAASKIQALQASLAKAAECYREQNKFNELIVCLIAVGAAMAACDGNVDTEEEANLREFVGGISAHALPPAIENAIQKLLTSPPTFDQAILYAEKLGPAVWPVIDNILIIVSESDGIVTEHEQEFLDNWRNFKIARQQVEAV